MPTDYREITLPTLSCLNYWDLA